MYIEGAANWYQLKRYNFVFYFADASISASQQKHNLLKSN